MKTMRNILFLASLMLMTTCNPPSPEDINIIPQPANAFVIPGSFTIDKNTRIITQMENEEVLDVCEYFNSYIERVAGFSLEIVDDKNVTSFSGDMVVTTYNADTSWSKETYSLQVQGGSSIVLQARTAVGLFYGVQTILQLLPAEIMGHQKVEDIDLTVPAVNIFDYARFEWRGMHLDVCRHIFSTDFIKKYIDLMAMYKMNVFHWHLTEDQGWRIAINKYPELTEIGAWRTEPDGTLYGGFYTQDQIREIVQYAADRNITIVPEIEMPGHCMAALAAYPELSCTGGPFEVASTWGVKEDVYCAGNEKTFEFLEDVLLEVMDLFPGEYIHIGGDEVPKTRWEHCPKCQARMRKEGLADESELQSYFIKRMEVFLKEHDRKLIGWDEILEGGLAPEATVMSWRGEQGGIEAAQMGHDVVMTPGDFCYFDHYQADPSTQPKAIGGLTTVKDVYHYNPVSAELNEAEQKHILGAQGNLWTEYIATPEYAEYMAVPRMIALAEVDWSIEKRIDWERFLRKLENHLFRLSILDVNYCDAVFEVEITPEYSRKDGGVMIRMASEFPGGKIRYTIDAPDPVMDSPLYDTAFKMETSGTIRARVFVDGKMKGHVSSREIDLHEAIGKPVYYKDSFDERYPGGGDFGLVNGLKGSLYYGDGNWQGFYGTDIELVIDLEKIMPVFEIRVGFLQNPSSWIFLPSKVTFMVSDTPAGGDFETVAEFLTGIPMEVKETIRKDYSWKFGNLNKRYIKIKASNPGPCPAWHPGDGSPSWVFIDEVVIE